MFAQQLPETNTPNDPSLPQPMLQNPIEINLQQKLAKQLKVKAHGQTKTDVEK
jgi:hypothetical protein